MSGWKPNYHSSGIIKDYGNDLVGWIYKVGFRRWAVYLSDAQDVYLLGVYKGLLRTAKKLVDSRAEFEMRGLE